LPDICGALKDNRVFAAALFFPVEDVDAQYQWNDRGIRKISEWNRLYTFSGNFYRVSAKVNVAVNFLLQTQTDTESMLNVRGMRRVLQATMLPMKA
jgi:hypothetical protein